MGLSFWQIALVVLLFVLLFGRGKVSDLMGDVAKGIKSFKKGLSEEDEGVAKSERLRVSDHKFETIVSDKNSEKTRR